MVCKVLGYGQDKVPTVTPGENNTSLIVSFLGVCNEDKNAYQVQLRRKSPQGEWTTKCVIVSETSSTLIFIFLLGVATVLGIGRSSEVLNLALHTKHVTGIQTYLNVLRIHYLRARGPGLVKVPPTW